jgi:hypothetical protein
VCHFKEAATAMVAVARKAIGIAVRRLQWAIRHCTPLPLRAGDCLTSYGNLSLSTAGEIASRDEKGDRGRLF